MSIVAMDPVIWRSTARWGGTLTIGYWGFKGWVSRMSKLLRQHEVKLTVFIIVLKEK